MNQIVVDKIVEQLNRVNSIPEVQRIVEEKNLKNGSLKNFNADYLVEEFRKISHAREKSYPTHRSEYRVTKTLIRLRNEIIYHLRQSTISADDKINVDIDNVLTEFIDLSKYLLDVLKRVGSIFEQEKNISRLAEEFDNTWKS